MLATDDVGCFMIKLSLSINEPLDLKSQIADRSPKIIFFGTYLKYFVFNW